MFVKNSWRYQDKLLSVQVKRRRVREIVFMYVKQIKYLMHIDCFLVSGPCLVIGMWYIMPNFRENLKKVGVFLCD